MPHILGGMSSSIIDQINENIFSGPVIQMSANISGLLEEGVVTIDNETLPIFQDFVIVLNDPNSLENGTKVGEATLKNILDSINTNLTDFKIIFNPESIAFGLGEDITPEESEFLKTLKSEISSAVKTVAQNCTGKLCIQNVGHESSTILAFNLTENPSQYLLKTVLKIWALIHLAL